jgi:hypothetical protein
MTLRCKSKLQSTGAISGLLGRRVRTALGDTIQNNRDAAKFDFNYARTHKGYSSHSAIVIDVSVDAQGGYSTTIGGNESDSVRRKMVRLDGKGLIKQRMSNPYIVTGWRSSRSR